MAAVPKAPLLNADIEFDGVDFSNSSNKVTIADSADKHDVTGFQGGGYKENQRGLKEATITIQIFQDRTAGGVHQTCKPLYDSGDTFVVKIKAEDDIVSAENPLSEMTGRLYGYNPIDASVGEPESMTLVIENASKAGLVELVE